MYTYMLVINWHLYTLWRYCLIFVFDWKFPLVGMVSKATNDLLRVKYTYKVEDFH